MATQDSYLDEKIKSNKPNQPNRPKPLGLSYFYELRLHAKFQLPRLCLSYISMVEEKKEEDNQQS